MSSTTQQASLFSGGSNPANERMSATVVADVWVAAEGAGFTPYTYAVPTDLVSDVVPGMAVVVPFGRQANVTGFVTSCRPKADSDPTYCKPIGGVLSDEALIDATHWAVLSAMARYTVTPLATVLQTALPPKLLGTGRSVLVVNRQRLANTPLASFDSGSRQVLQTLLASESPLTPLACAKRCGVSLSQLRTLLKPLQANGFVATQWTWQPPSQGRLVSVVTPVSGIRDDLALTPKQTDALATINQIYDAAKTPLPKKDLSVSDNLLKTLATKGAIQIERLPEHQVQYTQSAATLPTLTHDQQAVVEAVLSDTSTDPWLLHGVTGSGKTAVYLHLAKHALAQGKSALLLVPEIALTTQLAQRVCQAFPNAVVWHSNIAEGERIQLWQRLRQGEPLLILGARSAVLLPLSNVGMILLDEAHDGSFKQESPAPRYHAQWVAQQWAKKTNARLVLGSATPDLATMVHAQQGNRVLTLAERYGKNTSLAAVTCVDMRDAIRPQVNNSSETDATSNDTAQQPELPQPSLIAPQTAAALKSTVEAGQQAMVLINRRGYHTLVQCQTCGHTHQCEDCDVALTYHRPQRASSTAAPKAAYVLCHHCGYRAAAPDYCTHCASRQLRLMGTGSQRVVEALEKDLPGARISRLDRDVQQRRHAPEAILTAFANHQSDILVGTQMIAKGLDIPNVTLVVVLQADSALLLPDYRASERAFQLLTQVAGRAGRGQLAGQVLIQTWQPEHPVIQLAAQQDYHGFLDYEQPLREKLGFPPYAQLYRFVVSGEDDTLAMATAKALVARVNEGLGHVPHINTTVLGPAPCVISRVQGWYRFHLLVKVHSQDEAERQAVHHQLANIAQQLPSRTGLRVLLDVDAMSLL